MTVKPIADPTAPLIWIDVETTGLAPGSRIIEIAVCVTDANLQPLSEPASAVIWMQDWDVEQMEPAAREMHQRSGLLDQARADLCDFVESTTRRHG